MNKIELNQEIEKLKVSLEAHEDQVKDLQHDLNTAKQRLEDVDKPKLTDKQFSKLHDVIENTLENFDFNNCNNYEPEFEMDYDGKVGLAHITPLDFQTLYTLSILYCLILYPFQRYSCQLH